ncbi:MAG: stage II sporulation protein M [Planctomycetes bacterium]|nr:stage II sporulation protein M [Planctomycetota bacterium]
MTTRRRETRSVAFRRDREASWRRLERVLDTVESRGLTALPERELLELPTLHRAALSALSVARAISLDRALLAYLESLAARSHGFVHGARGRPLAAFERFVLVGFPAAVREHAWAVALAGGVLLLGVLTGFAVTTAQPEFYDSFVPSGLAAGRDFHATAEELRAPLYTEPEFASALALFASFLFQHNAQIAILCFALGAAAGVPVVWLLFTNGLTLGAMAALYASHGLGAEFWAWILPHGVPELLAIVLCGAAGLLQGQAVLLPGRCSRAEALRRVGAPAATIVLGSVAMLALAALIEGFFRQLVHAVPIRAVVAGGMSGFWILYFGSAGRSPR